MVPVLSTYSFGNRSIGKPDLPAKLRPVAIAAIPDSESALVARPLRRGGEGRKRGHMRSSASATPAC